MWMRRAIHPSLILFAAISTARADATATDKRLFDCIAGAVGEKIVATTGKASRQEVQSFAVDRCAVEAMAVLELRGGEAGKAAFLQLFDAVYDDPAFIKILVANARAGVRY